MIRIFFLCIALSLHSLENTAVTENDPSSFVEGVSMITGDFYTADEHLVVQGKEPIELRRHYVSSDGKWGDYQHLYASLYVQGGYFEVAEPNGTILAYVPVGSTIKKKADQIEIVHPKKPKKENRGSYVAHNFHEMAAGVSNTSSGVISARTNMQNQRLQQDDNGKGFTLYAANGTKRRYRNLEGQERIDFGCGVKAYFKYDYMLESEELPNGNKISYFWNHKNKLTEIRTTNRHGSKTYARILVPSPDPVAPAAPLQFSGSDGSSLFTRAEGEKYTITSSDHPELQFSFTLQNRIRLLNTIALPKGRNLHIEYDNSPRHRVKTISSPFGVGGAPLITHSFFYDPANNTSYVLDSAGNKTAYFWNDQYRLTHIERYSGQALLHSVDQFAWNGTRLVSKAFLDNKRQTLSSRTLTYDDKGNVLEELFCGCNGEKRSEKTSYNERNLPVKQVGVNGLVTLTSYRSDCSLPVSSFTCDGDEIKIRQLYEYDDDLILVKETFDDGVSQLIKEITPLREGPYLGLPHIIEEKQGNGSLLKRTVLHYTSRALVAQKDIYDADGAFRYSLYMDYDEKGRLIRETNPLGQEALSKYDEVGNRIYTKDFSGRLETFTHFDCCNRLIKKEEIGFDGIRRAFHYSYDLKHNLIAETDEYGNETKYIYDALGRRIETHLPSKGIIRQAYDCAGNEILRVDAEGYAVATEYNAYRKPVRVTHHDGAQEEWIYASDGILKSAIDAEGTATIYKQDYLGRIVQKTLEDAVESFEYVGNHLASKTDAEGNKTLYRYDGAGRKIEEEFSGETIRFFYDSLGRLNRVQKGDLLTITEYDLLDRIVEKREESISGELFQKERYEYDSAGNRTGLFRWVGGKESVEKSVYDSFNRLIQKTDPVGATETIRYEGEKALQKIHTDPMGLETIETYDAEKRLIRVEKRRGKTLFLEEKQYDGRGFLVYQVDTAFSFDGSQRTIATRWEYDSRGRLTSLTEADGTLDAKTTRREYTANGKLARLIKPDGVVLTYEYNKLGYLIHLRSSDGTVCHRMRYNRLGHLIETDGIERSVDAKGRMTSEAFVSGIRLDYCFDGRGRRIECSIPLAGCKIGYEYNDAHLTRVARKTLDQETLYSHCYLTHDLAGNILEESLIGGCGQVQYTLDPKSQRSKITAPHFSETILESDLLGNILKMDIAGEEVVYSYDELYQLISESGLFAHTYRFDSLNNRLEKDEESYKVNDLHQIVSHIEYDKNGNPIREGDTLYAFDALDRLIRIETPTFIETYEYDSLHRRLSKTSNQEGIVEKRVFLWDGQNEIGAFDEDLNLLELRILGDVSHGERGSAIAMELKGEIFAPIHDLQGNIAALLPLKEGEPVLIRYSAFGEEKIAGSTMISWRFSSKRVDASGLIYFGRRFYSPKFGRWLTPDPAGFADGMNLYAYVHNDPLTHFDDYGLLTQTPRGMRIPLTGPNFRFEPTWDQSRILPSLNPNPKYAPHFVVNGIQNTLDDAISGARTLLKTYGGKANIIPAYSASYRFCGDMSSVYQSKKDPDYHTYFIKKLSNELLLNILYMDVFQDPRKIFITCFSRGSTDVYHACKSFSSEHKNRLIITACGPIMILPRNLGFIVKNLISEGDWPSLACNRGLKEKLNDREFKNSYDVELLDQIDGYSGICKDHFFQSRTYQTGIKTHCVQNYRKYGELK